MTKETSKKNGKKGTEWALEISYTRYIKNVIELATPCRVKDKNIRKTQKNRKTFRFERKKMHVSYTKYYKTKKSASFSYFDTCFMHNIGVSDIQ